jgi:hypothetical protein
MDWLARFPPYGGVALDARPFGPPELKLVVVQMDHFFDYAMEYLAERGYRVDRKKRLVEGAGTA